MQLKLYIKYNMSVMTSYEVSKWVDETFGEDNIIEFIEIRDPFGRLQGFDVVVKVK